MPCFVVFGLEFEKNIVIFELSVLGFVLLQSLVQKYKSLNLRPKTSGLSIFRPGFENNIVIFEISTLEFV